MTDDGAVTSGEVEALGPMQQGTVVRQRLAGPGGRAIPADLRVTTYETNTRYSFEVIAGPVRPHGDFRFLSLPEGTEVSFSLSAELGGVKKWVMERSVQRAMDSEVAALDDAKRSSRAAEP